MALNNDIFSEYRNKLRIENPGISDLEISRRFQEAMKKLFEGTPRFSRSYTAKGLNFTMRERHKKKRDEDNQFDYEITTVHYMFPHNGVPYEFQHDSDFLMDERDVDHGLAHWKLIQEHYLPLIKDVYERLNLRYCTLNQTLDSKIWVMLGGGTQIQVFFGTDAEGYLGILYLDYQSKAGMKGPYNLVPNWDHNNKYFEHFSVRNVNVIPARSSETE